MNDLIKREDAIKAMEQRYQDILRIFKRKVKDGEKAVVLDMIGCVKSLPSADRPQGKWAHQRNAFGIMEHKCSVCGVSFTTMDTYNFKYCFNCGARMKDVTEGLESRTDLIWYGDKTDLIGDETGRHTGWFGKGADDE